MADKKRIFVTVGTTKFEKLIHTVTSNDCIKIFKDLGYNHATLQIGCGEYEPASIETPTFTRTVYRYKPSILQDVREADLVISHAGAGSCLETLGLGKPLVVVINEDLMDNHQMELAHKLHELGHVYYTNCRGLTKTLQTIDLSSLQPFEKGHPERLADFIDRVVGI